MGCKRFFSKGIYGPAAQLSPIVGPAGQHSIALRAKILISTRRALRASYILILALSQLLLLVLPSILLPNYLVVGQYSTSCP